MRYVAYKTTKLSPESMTGDLSKEAWQEVAWTKESRCTWEKLVMGRLMFVGLRCCLFSPHLLSLELVGLCGHLHSHHSAASDPSEDAMG